MREIDVRLWTDREDRIVAAKLDHPSISFAELRTALAAIGCKRTEKGIESRLHILRLKRAADGRSSWLTDPFLTGRKIA
jgi:hypothetical protein